MAKFYDYGNPETNASMWASGMHFRKVWLKHARTYEECPIKFDSANSEWKANGVKYCLKKAADCLAQIRFFRSRF